VKQYCTGCHSDRGQGRQLTLASFDASAPQSRSLRHHRKDDSQAARGHDAAREARAVAARTQISRWPKRSKPASIAPRAQSQSRLASLPAPQSRE
jgi:hypothetical protein